MEISRRDFLKYCGLTAAVLGLSTKELSLLEKALADPNGPTVLWMQGAGCTGCSMSFLNYLSTTAPTSAADILINNINLAYHPNLMATAGQGAAEVAREAYNRGGYILAVEGAVPQAFGGRACWAWTHNGEEVTFLQAVKDMASKAATVLSIGTCASFGGIPAAGRNPSASASVSSVTGQQTINIAGCPPHPDWVVYTIVQLLLGQSLPLDASRRPTAIFGETVHRRCSREGEDNCLWDQGCRGPGTHANCATILWNNRANWCVSANAPCYGCTEPTFPGEASLYTVMYNPHGTTDLNCAACHGGGGGDAPPNPHGYTTNNCSNCHD